MKARKKPMKGRKYNALIRRLVGKPGIKSPLGQKSPGTYSSIECSV